MKNRLLAATMLLVLISLMAATGIASADDGGGQGLVPTVTWDKESVFPGAEVEINVEYKNEGAASIPNDAQVKFHLVIRERKTDENKEPAVVLLTPDVDVPKAPGTGIGQSFPVTATITAPQEGNYTLVAVLTVNNEEPIESLEDFPVKSALPPGLARVFAGLGMFAAVMAIMAVGTEVVIDMSKVFLGMKQKVTALEAFDQLKEQLPGQLAKLGVDPKSLGKVDALLGQLGSLRPKIDAALGLQAAASSALLAGNLGDAWQRIGDLEKELKALSPKSGLARTINDLQKKVGMNLGRTEADVLNDIRATAQKGVEQILTRLQVLFKLDQATVDALRAAAGQQIAALTPDMINAGAGWVNSILAEIQKHGSQWTADWLKSQANTYLAVGRDQFMGLLKSDVIPILGALGFAPEQTEAVEAAIGRELGNCETLLKNEAETYSLAVRNLLDAVEDMRNKMASPARKIWRRLRRSDAPVLPIGVIGIILFGVALALLGSVPDPGHSVATTLSTWPGPVWPWFGSVLGAVVVPVLIWASLIFGIGVIVSIVLYAGYAVPRGDAPRIDKLSLGSYLTGVETLLNMLTGRHDEANELGEVPTDVKNQIRSIEPTTVAATLLRREDKHQDEEESRIRALRVVSIVVGTILAYTLQVNALKLLEEALPGAAGFDKPLIPGEQLQRLWAALQNDLTTGILLTGLAASAGSKFWRDLLGRLQATKQQAESAAVLLRKTRKSLGLEEEQ